MTPTATRDPRQHWLGLFAGFEKAPAAPAIARLRQAGIAAFGQLGFPGPRDEDWKFTSLAPLHRHAFPHEAAPPVLPAAPQGAVVCSLAEGLAKHGAEPFLGRIADHRSLPLVALNTAFLSEGVFIRVPQGVACEEPILIDHPPGGFRRVLIVVEAGAQVAVAERFAGTGVYFTCAVTEAHVGESASLDHYKSQRESGEAFHLGTLAVQMERASRFSTHYLGLGGALVRHEARVLFRGEGAEATVNGLYQAAGSQHLDNHTVIDHAVPHCASHELYKGILDGKSHGVFNGKIFVRQDAQKTDAKQSNQTLLLSDEATINTKPQLEIFADDVKCTHGATVGQLDEGQLFYLRSRGIGEAQARALLTFAFANDVVSRVKVPALRRELEAALLEAHHLPRLGLMEGDE
jgi:Fe-S cluster assembly protein SufD